MAIIKSGILGKINGSLANVTTYNLKRQQLIRQKAVNVANPDTPAQQAVRNNLVFAIGVYQILKPLLVLSLRQRAKKQSVLSEFLRLNLNKSIVNSELDFDKLVIFKPNSDSTPLVFTFDQNLEDRINGAILDN